MNPAEPESVPPMRNPIAIWRPFASEASSVIPSRIASTSATPPMIVYWRRR
jgi:hypothetical protein